MLLAGVAATGLIAAGGLVQADVLPGRTKLARLLGQGEVAAGVPDVDIGDIRRSSFRSSARGGAGTTWILALPPDVPIDGLPVCVVLHGRGDTAESMVDIGYPQFLAAAVQAGAAPFALASVDGGERYWHARKDGDDCGRMVTDELLPRLHDAGLAAAFTDRIAFLGWSMGGYGSLLLGSRLGKDRVAAVVAESPALWRSPGDSAPGAFDDREDFVRNDVFADRSQRLRGISVKIDCGRADPFYSAAKSFGKGLTPRPNENFGAGDHTHDYWRSVAPSSINFLANALSPRRGTGDSIVN